MITPVSRGCGRAVVLIGVGQMLGWGSSYYLISTLAQPMAAELGVPIRVVFGMFSAGLVVSSLLGPRIGRWIDQRGGRLSLMTSNVVLSAALVILASSSHLFQLGLGWLLLCLAMPFGLYEAAFATLIGMYGHNVRRPITYVTLIAGLGSAVSWPVTSAIVSNLGWRPACLFWAFAQLSVSFWLHRALPRLPSPTSTHAKQVTSSALPRAHRRNFLLLSVSYLTISTCFGAIASHLPRVLELERISAASAIAIASLFGVAQISGRLLDLTVLRKRSPVAMARLAHLVLPIGAILLLIGGAPFAATFTILHGIGIGILTICKGLLPLSLFGSEDYARRTALIDRPARFVGALTPFLFGTAVDRLGIAAMNLYLVDALLGLGAAMLLHRPRQNSSSRIPKASDADALSVRVALADTGDVSARPAVGQRA